MHASDAKHRLLATQTTLQEAGSFRKFHAIKNTAMGIHSHLDRVLAYAETEFSKVEPILGPDFVVLNGENLPENTSAQKMRKEAIHHFTKTWAYLRDEVEYVHKEMNKDRARHLRALASPLRYLFRFLTGPIGILCILLAAFLWWSSSTSVEISIRNHGCPTIVPKSPIPNFIPGIYIPNDPIQGDGSAEMRIPVIPITFEDHANGTMTIDSIFFHMALNIQGVKSIMFDDMELLLHRTDINLSKQKMHYIQFTC